MHSSAASEVAITPSRSRPARRMLPGVGGKSMQLGLSPDRQGMPALET